MLLVVDLDQVLDDGSGLPQNDVGIGVVDGWYPTVGIYGYVLGVFDFG